MEASTLVPRVASFLDRTDYAKPIYIITGLKVVEGASVTTSPKKSRTLKAKLGFDSTPAGVPATVGLEAEHTKSTETKTQFRRSSTVVFAYQLSELRMKNKGGDVVLKDHTAGAIFEAGNGDTGERLEVELRANEVALDSKKVIPVFDKDGDEDCLCVVPIGQ